jgi:hypothetical protein
MNAFYREVVTMKGVQRSLEDFRTAEHVQQRSHQPIRPETRARNNWTMVSGPCHRFFQATAKTDGFDLLNRPNRYEVIESGRSYYWARVTRFSGIKVLINTFV